MFVVPTLALLKTSVDFGWSVASPSRVVPSLSVNCTEAASSKGARLRNAGRNNHFIGTVSPKPAGVQNLNGGAKLEECLRRHYRAIKPIGMRAGSAICEAGRTGCHAHGRYRRPRLQVVGAQNLIPARRAHERKA